MKVALIFLVLTTITTHVSAAPSAEELYTEGQAAYDHADYMTAIARWRASYELSGEQGLLFNLAQALRLFGDCSNALATYQQFIVTDPDPTSEQHKLAEDFMRELGASCDVRTPLSTPPNVDGSLNSGAPLHGREDHSTGRTLRIAGLVTSGAGAAVLVAGLLVGRHANTLANEVTDACATSCDWGVQKSKHAAGQRDAVIGYALDTVGSAAIASGVLLYYLGNRQRSVAVVPTAHETGAVVSWSGSW